MVRMFFFKRYKRFVMKHEYKYRDSKTNEIFKKYCILWHYYIPCVYTINCLVYKVNFANKINESWYSDTFRRLIMQFKQNIVPDDKAEVVINNVDMELEGLLKKYNILWQGYKNIIGSEAKFMLRTRISRLLYYLYPPGSIDTLYLQHRECGELISIFKFYHSNYSNNKIWTNFLEILENSDISITKKLNNILTYWKKNRAEMNEIMAK